MGIRSAAKCIILDQDKILLNKCYDEHNGEYYSLPGGGQNQYETLSDAIIRECLEETGYRVILERFATLYEEICDDEFIRTNYPDYAHKMYHIFVCRLQSEQREQPTEIDSMQIKSEWIEIKELDKIHLLPKAVGEHLFGIIRGDAPPYLGSGHVAYNHG